VIEALEGLHEGNAAGHNMRLTFDTSTFIVRSHLVPQFCEEMKATVGIYCALAHES
jgi:hypothetical protein